MFSIWFITKYFGLKLFDLNWFYSFNKNKINIKRTESNITIFLILKWILIWQKESLEHPVFPSGHPSKY